MRSEASPDPEAPPPRSLGDAVFEAVRDDIVEGRLPAGEPLRQDRIAIRLGVSKIPVREALTRLEAEGLVVGHVNRGFATAPLRRAEAVEALAIRIKLEPELAGRAAERATPEERQAARDAFDAMSEAEGFPLAYRLARTFHHSLCAPAKRPLAQGLVDRLAVLCDRYVIAYGVADRAAAPHAHRELLDFWLAGRRPQVEAICTAHLAEALDYFTTA